MKKYSTIKSFFLTILFLLSISNVHAQDNGIITGTVTDAVSGQTLPGATIKLVGTYTGVATDVRGSYSLFVEEGDVELEFSFIGNKSIIQKVNITAGETLVLDVALGGDVNELETVLVTATLAGQMRALNQQKSADNLKNIVSADQIGKFPDQNAAEALQRVPGVNIQRDEGDGRFVLVRGLSPNFTNISVNGEQIPSPDAGARFVALDAIPASQLASLEVTKAITPDMDGDAIGGSVNLITPTAQSEKLKIVGSTSLEYNSGIEKTSGQGNLSLSQRVADGKFGYIINGSYSASRKGSDRYELDGWDGDHPDGLDEFIVGDYEIDRNRIGLSATLDYKIGKNSKIYLRSLYSELQELEQRRETANVAENDDDDILEYSSEKELKHRQENQGVYSLNLGGNHISSKFKLNYSVSYAQAFQDTPFNDKIVFKNDEDVTWGVDLSDEFNPKLTNYTYDGSASAFGNSGNYILDGGEQSSTTAKDENTTLKFDIAIPLSLGDNTGEFKFGAKTRLKDKSYSFNNAQEFELADGVNDLTLSQFQSAYTDNNFMNGDLGESIGYFPDHSNFFNYLDANSSSFETDGAILDEESALESYQASEDVYAGFTQGKIQIDKLMILGGVRYELTKVKYKNAFWDADAEAPIPSITENDYGFILPMLHFKYSINSNTNLRAAITKSYARPNFEALVQGAEIAATDQEASISNPDLQPVESWNFDLFGEKYLGTVGILSGGIFHKNLNNFIYQQTYDGNILSYTDFEITQSVNGDEASITGIELAWQQNLTFLPGKLKGLGIYANYTFSESTASVVNFSEGSDLTEIDLPGQSKHIGNLALSYALGGFNARASINFNGSYIAEIDGGDLILIDDRKQIDLSISQSFMNNKFTGFIQLNNITDENQIELYNTRSTPKERQQYGFWGRVGLKFNL